MNVAKLVLGGVAAIGITASCMLCHNFKKEQKEVVTENMKDKIELPNNRIYPTARPDTVYCPCDTFWSKLTSEEAEYLGKISGYDKVYADTIKPISVDAAKKAYAAAKEAAKHIK